MPRQAFSELARRCDATEHAHMPSTAQHLNKYEPLRRGAHPHTHALVRAVRLVVRGKAQRLAIAGQHRARVPGVRHI